MRNGRAPARTGLRRWLALLGATTVALTFAATASAASAGVTGCAEVPTGYAITFSGSGFAPNAVVSAYDNGAFRGTTTADMRGDFADFTVLILSLPSGVSFVDTAGNTSTVTVTGCGGGGGGGGETPTTKDECKNGGYADFADPAFKNLGQCVSSVVSKNK